MLFITCHREERFFLSPRTCWVSCWLSAPSMECFVLLPEEQGQAGRREVAGVESALLKE